MVAARIRHIYVCSCYVIIFQKMTRSADSPSGGNQQDRDANHQADHHEPDIRHVGFLSGFTAGQDHLQTRSVLR
jgi:hypothetical protein